MDFLVFWFFFSLTLLYIGYFYDLDRKHATMVLEAKKVDVGNGKCCIQIIAKKIDG